jgi:hypothetical protein
LLEDIYTGIESSRDGQSGCSGLALTSSLSSSMLIDGCCSLATQPLLLLRFFRQLLQAPRDAPESLIVVESLLVSFSDFSFFFFSNRYYRVSEIISVLFVS